MPVETDPTMDEDGCRVRPGFPLSVSVSAGLAPLAGGQLPVTICHQVSALFVPAVEVWQPHVAQGARLMALLRGRAGIPTGMTVSVGRLHPSAFLILATAPQPRICAPGCGLSVASPVSLGSYLQMQWPVQ